MRKSEFLMLKALKSAPHLNDTAVLPAVFSVSVFCRIRFAGFSVFRSVLIPPFFVYFPPFLPPFFQKGVELLKKGAIAPLLRKKGGAAPFFIPKCTDQIFLRYRYGKYREIPTEYRPKIPNRYTTLVSTIMSLIFRPIAKNYLSLTQGNPR
jgi:hypothetical protein